MSWVNLLGFCAIGQAILMAAKYVFVKRNHQQVLLIGLFTLLACFLLHEVLVYSRLILQYTFLFGWGPLFPLIIAPLLYLYVRSLLNSKFSFKPPMLLHLLPFTIALASRAPQILMSAEQKAARLSVIFANLNSIPADATVTFGWSQLWHFTLWHLQPIIYFALIVWLIWQSRERIYLAKDLAKWIKYLSFGLFLYFLGDYITEVSLPRHLGIHKAMVMIPLFSVYIFSLCLVVLSHPSSSYVVNAIPEDQISRSETNKYFERLEAIMQQKKAYLKTDLQLAELAKEVGLAGRELSQVISISCGKSFNDYLNTQRVAHAQELLKTPRYQRYTMSAIGEESGFRSKDAFYRAFKKFTSETPKTYLDGVLQS